MISTLKNTNQDWSSFLKHEESPTVGLNNSFNKTDYQTDFEIKTNNNSEVLLNTKSRKLFSTEVDTSIVFSIIPADNKRKSSSNQLSYHTLIRESNYETWLEVMTIEQNIFKLQNKGLIEKTLDFIFDKIDDLALSRNFNTINYLLYLIDVNQLTVDSIVGLLVITSNWKNDLPSRKSFYLKAKNCLVEKDINHKEIILFRQ